jgi:hypothetical protein
VAGAESLDGEGDGVAPDAGALDAGALESRVLGAGALESRVLGAGALETGAPETGPIAGDDAAADDEPAPLPPVGDAARADVAEVVPGDADDADGPAELLLVQAATISPAATTPTTMRRSANRWARDRTAIPPEPRRPPR